MRDDGGFPKVSPADLGAEFVDFGWTDDVDKKKTGRRKKLQRKIKPGSFGERRLLLPPPPPPPPPPPAIACVRVLAAAAAYAPSDALRCHHSPADTMGLSESVLRAIRRKGFRLPTPIQRKTLPLIMQVRVLPGGEG